MLALEVVIWACVCLFVVTAIIAILALLGRITLGGGDGKKHDYYLRKLFTVLMLEVAAAAVGAFAYFLAEAARSRVTVEKPTSTTGTFNSTSPPDTFATDTITNTSVMTETTESTDTAITQTSTLPSKDVLAPNAKYAVTDAISLPYGQWTRINYNKRITDIAVEVTTGSNWALRVPKEGTYAISASVITDVRADVRIDVRTSTVVLMNSPVIPDASGAVTRVDLSGNVVLRKDEAIYVQAVHSMHATRVVDGEFSIKLLD
jgi:hypothetical protein